MEIKMDQSAETKKSIQEHYTPQQPPTEQELKEHREKREKFLDETLPFMRKEAEYNRLLMELTELDVLMGRQSAKTVQGLLGLELVVREVQAQAWMSQWMSGQKAAMEQQKKDNEELTKMQELEKQALEEWANLPEEERMKRQQEAVDAYNKVVEEQKAMQAAQGTNE